MALIFALSGGSDGPLGSLGGDTPETPEFAFKASKPIVITTAPTPTPKRPSPPPVRCKAAKKKATAAALTRPRRSAVDTLDAYYTAAFLDPANWQDAAYDEVFVSFTNQARAEAESQLEVMTAGSEAGFNYDTIEPLPSTVRDQGAAGSERAAGIGVGMAKFQANGDGSSGGKHVFQSKGQFVLQKIDGEWIDREFLGVSRHDKDKGTLASATAFGVGRSLGGSGSSS